MPWILTNREGESKARNEPTTDGSTPFDLRVRRTARRYDLSLPSLVRVGHPPVFLLGNNPPSDSRLYLILNPRVLRPYLQKEAQPTMKPNSDVANKGIEGILELSADAHVLRRGTVKDSPEFHRLTGAIAAYGKALAVLWALQEREKFCATIAQHDVPGCVVAH